MSLMMTERLHTMAALKHKQLQINLVCSFGLNELNQCCAQIEKAQLDPTLYQSYPAIQCAMLEQPGFFDRYQDLLDMGISWRRSVHPACLRSMNMRCTSILPYRILLRQRSSAPTWYISIKPISSRRVCYRRKNAACSRTTVCTGICSHTKPSIHSRFLLRIPYCWAIWIRYAPSTLTICSVCRSSRNCRR